MLFFLIKNKLYLNYLEPNATISDIYSIDLPSKLKPAHVRMLLLDGILTNPNSKAKPSDMFEEFQALVMISFPIDKFYKKHIHSTSKKTSPYTLIIMFLAFISFGFIKYSIGFILASFFCGLFLFSNPSRYSLSQTGVNEKTWLNFRKYIAEHSYIDEKNTEMINMFRNIF